MGDTVLVTGASSGIGEACARDLAQRGFTVLAGVRSDADAERIGSIHPGVDPVRLDVTDSASIDTVAQAHGEAPWPAWSTTPGSRSARRWSSSRGEWRRQLEVNVLGQVAVTHAITAQRPRTRYPVGRDARQRIRIAGLLPERAFDALVARMLKTG